MLHRRTFSVSTPPFSSRSVSHTFLAVGARQVVQHVGGANFLLLELHDDANLLLEHLGLTLEIRDAHDVSPQAGDLRLDRIDPLFGL